jgi:hypothetical protein
MIRGIMKQKGSLRGGISSRSSPVSLDNKQSPKMFLQSSEQGAVTTSREEIDGFLVSHSSIFSQNAESIQKFSMEQNVPFLCFLTANRKGRTQVWMKRQEWVYLETGKTEFGRMVAKRHKFRKRKDLNKKEV